MSFCGVGCEYTKSVHVLGQEVHGNSISQSLWYEPETSLKKCFLKKQWILKIKSRITGRSRDSRSPFCMTRLERPHCSDMWNFTVSLYNLRKPACDEWLGISCLVYCTQDLDHRDLAGLHPVDGELFFLFVKMEWDHVSNEELYKLSNANINCSWIYKCNRNISMCESWL